MRRGLPSLALAAWLCAGPAAAESTAELKAQLEEAMRTIRDLQSRVVTLERQQAQVAAQPAAAPAASSAASAPTAAPLAAGSVLVHAPESVPLKREPDPNQARIEFTGKVQYQDVTVSKKQDEHSSKLMQFAVQGKLIETVEIVINTSKGPMKYTLRQVYISAYQTGSGTPDQATESLTLTFGDMEYKLPEGSK